MSGRSMLRPDRVELCSRLEPFSQTEPHHPVLLWPVERMDDIHLTDCVAQQVHPKRNSRATDDFPRAVAEQLRSLRTGPGHARVVEDSSVDWQDSVIAATETE